MLACTHVFSIVFPVNDSVSAPFNIEQAQIDAKGHIWFGNTNGISVLNTISETFRHIHTPAFFLAFCTNGYWVACDLQEAHLGNEKGERLLLFNTLQGLLKVSILYKKVCKAQKFTILGLLNLKSIDYELYTTASK